jgi:hypothetical protein
LQSRTVLGLADDGTGSHPVGRAIALDPTCLVLAGITGPFIVGFTNMHAQMAPTQPCGAEQPQTLTKTQASLHGRNLELNTHKTQQTHNQKLWWEISHYFQTVHFAKSRKLQETKALY